MSEPQISTTSAGQLTGLPPSWRLHLAASHLSPARSAPTPAPGALFAAFLAGKGMPTATASIRREHVEAFIVAELARTADRRPGRAVAVTLIAATQRPMQKAMGQGAWRSQMDARICFRVRERRGVDLILGPGMLDAGWQADAKRAYMLRHVKKAIAARKTR